MADDHTTPIRRALSWLVLSLVLSTAWLANGSAPAAATPVEIARERSPGIDIRVQGPHNAVVRRPFEDPDKPHAESSASDDPPTAWSALDSRFARQETHQSRYAKAYTSFRLVLSIVRTPASPRAPPHLPFA